VDVGRTDRLFDGGGEMGRIMAGRDWTLTPLGPPEGWPASLRSAVRILLTSRFAMWMGWGPELTFFYNDAYRRDTLRAKHPWALGQPAGAVWAEIWDDIGPRIASVLDSGVATWDEDLMLFLERSGYPEETYHTFSYSPLSDAGGTVAGMLCVVAEDTDRVLSERRMATLRELATDLATGHTEQQVLDALRHRLSANPRDLPFTLTYLFTGDGEAALAAATGAEPGDPIAPHAGADAWPVAELLAGRTAFVEGLRERFAQLPAGAWPEPPVHAVAVPLAQPGSNRPSGFLVAGLNPFRPYDERYRGFVELLANQVATGLGNARAYEAERRRAEALAELDRAKTEFFTGISHEFRTPLTLIMGPLGELRAAPAIEADPRLRTELDVVHRNGLRLEKLVNELLDFSRLQAGRMQARFEPVSLSAFTADLASVFRSAMHRAALEYEVDCPPLDEPVWVDRGMWEKVVLNLLSNAVKFTLDGRVVVAVRQDGDRVQLTVADSGTGIPAEELPHLFERFHRVAGATSRSGEGSGIGLATVREVVALHGGTIDAASTPGVGTTFTVTLRTGREHLPDDQIAAAAAPPVFPAVSEAAEPFLAEALRWLPDGGGVPASPAGPRSASAARVLVADDNADMREYVQRLLADRYTVHTAADGDAALAAALADPPDLVVSDVMMPGLDGMALLAALRGDQRTAHVPVLLLSARAGQEAAVEGLAAGADDYLVKPFTAVELLARVDGHVKLGRARRRERERQRVLAAVGAAMDREPGLPGRRAALVRVLVAEGIVDVARLIDDRTRVVATAGPDQATERLLAEIRVDPPLARRVLATGKPAVAEVDEDYVRASSDDLAQQDLQRRLDMRSVVFVPLVARGRVGGLLATARIGGAAPQTETDLALLAEIGERAAVALDNALLYDREQLTSRRLALLQRATAALSAAATPVQVAEVAAAEFERLLGSSASGVWELHANALEAVAERGWTERVAADWRIIHLDIPIMATDAVRHREPVWTGTREDWDRDYPQMRQVVASYGYASVGALPLLAGGRCLGVAVVVFAEEREVDEAERAAAMALADQCAQAFQRAALLAAESAARQTAEEIGEVVAALSGATTPRDVIDVILQHAARLGAEAAAVLLREGEHVEVVAAWGAAGTERQLRLDAAHPIAYAVRAGQAVWQDRRSAIAWPKHTFSTAGVDLPAQVVLPLLLGGSAIGAVALGFAEPPVFTTEQRATVLTIAGQCAQALDRARLHQAEHEIAEVLQRSLLPGELPRLERLGAAARYLPGAAGSQTGGDWYDLLTLNDQCTALVVGRRRRAGAGRGRGHGAAAQRAGRLPAGGAPARSCPRAARRVRWPRPWRAGQHLRLRHRELGRRRAALGTGRAPAHPARRRPRWWPRRTVPRGRRRHGAGRPRPPALHRGPRGRGARGVGGALHGRADRAPQRGARRRPGPVAAERRGPRRRRARAPRRRPARRGARRARCA
jgi:signal transduction histidine kinase/CheY-like chemotaxis protein